MRKRKVDIEAAFSFHSPLSMAVVAVGNFTWNYKLKGISLRACHSDLKIIEKFCQILKTSFLSLFPPSLSLLLPAGIGDVADRGKNCELVLFLKTSPFPLAAS